MLVPLAFLLMLQEPGPITVYVWTQQSQFTDADQARRVDSVKDIREQLAKAKNVQVVGSEKDADITVEVTASSKLPVASTTTIFLPGQAVTQAKSTTTLTGVLRVRGTDYQTELTAQNPNVYSWKVLTSYWVGRQFNPWIEKNLDLVRQSRKSEGEHQ
jgi:hypothetical protein